METTKPTRMHYSTLLALNKSVRSKYRGDSRKEQMMNWIKEIDDITEKFIQKFKDLNKDELNWKLNSETWSIAQNINHLIVLNRTYFSIFDNLKRGKNELPFISKIGFISSFMGKAILKAVSPENKSKTKTFPIWEPEKSEISDNILAEFQVHQNKLKEYIENSNNYLKNKTLISSPANKNIVYKLETAFDIIVTHEKRHLEQAIKVKDLITKSTSR
ncbi:DinB family protein [Gramella sp. AN32]|uniref:DinB family protein n=1 Tax=Christiangramia antarctica TaxID=2058158 RepID=A0ABW5X3Y3_9FLAO|nr:DinB family protein [Gramella sp. AN32]